MDVRTILAIMVTGGLWGLAACSGGPGAPVSTEFLPRDPTPTARDQPAPTRENPNGNAPTGGGNSAPPGDPATDQEDSGIAGDTDAASSSSTGGSTSGRANCAHLSDCCASAGSSAPSECNSFVQANDDSRCAQFLALLKATKTCN